MKYWLSGNDVAGQDPGQGRWASSPGSSAKAPEGGSCVRLGLEGAQQPGAPRDRDEMHSLLGMEFTGGNG